MFRKLRRLILFVLILVVVGLVAGYFYIDSIAKAAIEQGGSYALGVDTTLRKAKVGLLDGTVALRELNVANPRGFDSAHFLALDKGDMEVSLASLRKDVVTLPALKFAGLDVNLQKSRGKTNYDVILKNLKRFESAEDTSQKEGQESGKRYRVETLVIKNVVVHVDMVPEGGELTKLDFPLDRVVLRDVGSDKGVPMGELAAIIVKAVLGAVADKGGDILPAELIGDLQSGLSNLTSLDSLGIDFSSELPGDLGETIKDIGGGLGEGLNDVGNTIGNLLGGDEQKDDTSSRKSDRKRNKRRNDGN